MDSDSDFVGSTRWVAGGSFICGAAGLAEYPIICGIRFRLFGDAAAGVPAGT
jgi:hypothetical protein